MKCCPWVVCGSICGGEKRKSEKGRLRKGVNVLVATPGRALDHLLKTESFCVDNLEWVVIDEADRLFDMGFEKQVSAIVDQLNAKKKAGPEFRARSIVLVSATITPKVLELASTCSVRAQNPVVLQSSASSSSSGTAHNSKSVAEPTTQREDVKLPENLSQYFTVSHFKQRLVLLSSFLLSEVHKKPAAKIMVFFSTCDSVDFHKRLFEDDVSSRNGDPRGAGGGFQQVFRCMSLHGKMTQTERKKGSPYDPLPPPPPEPFTRVGGWVVSNLVVVCQYVLSRSIFASATFSVVPILAALTTSPLSAMKVEVCVGGVVGVRSEAEIPSQQQPTQKKRQLSRHLPMYQQVGGL